MELEGTARGEVSMAYMDTEHFTRKDSDGKTVKVEKWSWKGKRDPTMMQKKRMIASMLQVLVKTLMKNHHYQFDGKLYLQQTGGPIGLKLSGVLARLVMLKFDKLYLERLKKLRVDAVLYQRYIDDLNMALSCLPPGMRFSDNKLVLVPELAQTDQTISDDVRTARLMKEIANSIMPSMIVMEEDSPSLHTNGRLPVLDMEFWVEFYKKPMATRKVTMARSALATLQKRKILVEEASRRLSNYSPDLPWSVKVHSLNLLCIDMHDCEHSERFRTTVISRAVGKYQKNLANHNNGVKVMFRTKEEREEYTKSNGGRKNKATWFRGGKDAVTTTTTVPTTPGGQLAEQMVSALASCPGPGRCRTKVLEGGGTSVKRNLVSSNPFPRQSCCRPDCLLYNTIL